MPHVETAEQHSRIDVEVWGIGREAVLGGGIVKSPENRETLGNHLPALGHPDLNTAKGCKHIEAGSRGRLSVAEIDLDAPEECTDAPTLKLLRVRGNLIS